MTLTFPSSGEVASALAVLFRTLTPLTLPDDCWLLRLDMQSLPFKTAQHWYNFAPVKVSQKTHVDLSGIKVEPMLTALENPIYSIDGFSVTSSKLFTRND